MASHENVEKYLGRKRYKGGGQEKFMGRILTESGLKNKRFDKQKKDHQQFLKEIK